MSLKDEIEKLIRLEQEKLSTRSAKQTEHYERQRERFGPIRPLLQEIIASVEAAFVRGQVHESSATIELGRVSSQNFETDIRWRIEPNGRFEYPEARTIEEQGFRLEEVEYFRFPEYDVSERTQTFATEQLLAEYLVGKIAHQVAHYRHLESIRPATKKT